jgi:fatty-acyl-CoA synthase
MDDGSRLDSVAPKGLLLIEDCLDADGQIALPPGTTLISLIERNVANVGDATAYRYLDYARSEGNVREVTWAQLGARLTAIGARVQKFAGNGDRVAILAPQGIDYVAGFYAAIKAGSIAVPLFAPELPGHAERLETALLDSKPITVLTTAAAKDAVENFLDSVPQLPRPHVIVIDQVPDSEAELFVPVDLGMDHVSHLQYTSGATRPPAGVEITHRAVGTNLVQMILSIDLLNRNTHGVSWLPLYHDMGLSMIGFPAVYGGHSTLMSPTAFVRRPQRWIQALAAGSREGRVVTAAPNFAYEWAAQRGIPPAGGDVDLSNVVLIIGSEPVSIDAITAFNKSFAPYGLPRTAFKPSYGIAEATLMIATIDHDAEATVAYLDREQLAGGRGCGQCRRAGVVRPGRSQPVGGDRRPGNRHRTARWSGRGSVAAGQQHWSRLLGAARGNRADVRRQTAIATGRRQPRRGVGGRGLLAADRRPGHVSRRGAVCHRPDRGSGGDRWSQPLSARHRGHRHRGLADGAARIRHGVRRAGRRGAR